METWEQVTFQEAHDSEILTIDFTDPRKKGNNNFLNGRLYLFFVTNICHLM